MEAARPEAFFQPADGRAGGQRLYVYHRPAQAVARGALLFVPPLAEEMNKTRRMVALQARRLAAAGFAVLLADLHGCGDNPDDLGDTTWDDWIDDVARASRWLASRHAAPLWLWGMRSGALLARAASPRLDAPCSFLFWQPATQGSSVLQQFLRLKAAADMLEGGARGVMDALRKQLRAGHPVEVAGYCLPPALAEGLQHATLAPPSAPARAEWLELRACADDPASPATERAVTAWRAAGSHVRVHAVPGLAFWQTTDIEEVPALLDATERALMATAPEAALQPMPSAGHKTLGPVQQA